MMTLHLLNKSPQHFALYRNMLSALGSEDAILLIEDGAYGALDAHSSLFADLPASVSVHALKADVDARGLSTKLYDAIIQVDDRQFVALSCEYDKVVSWY